MRIAALALTAALCSIPTISALPVEASSAPLSSGSCSASPYFANFSARYTSDASYDYFTLYSWTLSGTQLGRRSKVEVRVKHHNSFGHDPIYFTWISPADVRPGTTRLGPTRVRVPKGESAYVEFKITFDRPIGWDRGCTGKTRPV
jgi:hypothetical protein